MTHADLAASYLRSARRRLPTLDLLLASEGYNDVVRGAQDIVELAGKAMLRAIGSDPPHVHDVGERLLAHLERFAPEVRADLPRLAQVSRQLNSTANSDFEVCGGHCFWRRWSLFTGRRRGRWLGNVVAVVG